MSRFRTRRGFWAARSLAAGGLAAGVVLVASLFASRWWPVLDTDAGPSEVLELSVNDEELQQPATLPRAPDRETILPKGTELGWPTLLGPSHDSTSPETGINLEWGADGPWEKWRIDVGCGYSAPVVLDDSLVLLQRRDDLEVIACYDPETGQTRWEHSWPTDYRPRHSYSSGPYSTPVLEAGRAYAVGANGRMLCLRLADGEVLWQRDLHGDYRVAVEMWPVSPSPLVEADSLILNLGGREAGAGIVALDKHTGQTLWTATSDGASCSTARAATIHGRRHVFVWTAEALVSVEPADGTVRWRIPFAANNSEAAHGSAPLVAGDIVLVSGYQVGNLCVRVLPDGSYEELWRDQRNLLDSQYTPLLHVNGGVCGFSATRQKLRCL
ncbi:MAG: PQQ-binding-like beta-propeller repeat protein, partial [Patescibacteria group bacterium]|nr:PQQ-binding-like beta-propeller repeat protein [Patescibacteria group bacterium]